MREPMVHVGGRTGSGLLEVTSDFARVAAGGTWFVTVTFEGQAAALRFADWREEPLPAGEWPGTGAWSSDKSRAGYLSEVEQVRAGIAAGDYYQVNLCRRLATPWPSGGEPFGLATLLAEGNPAPYAAVADVEDERLRALLGDSRLWLVSASPELFLEVAERRVTSAPIKGTVRPGEEFLEKDVSENVMIVDLVRNDLSAVCEPGSVEVDRLLERVSHPGLDHLVSTVSGRLLPTVGWPQVFAAAFPPGSVTGAPKSAALRAIGALESPRQFYCGTIGVIDSDAGTARLNVAIRTFWFADGELRFGVGSGITWGSDAAGEWAETELKAARLIEVAGWSTR